MIDYRLVYERRTADVLQECGESMTQIDCIFMGKLELK